MIFLCQIASIVVCRNVISYLCKIRSNRVPLNQLESAPIHIQIPSKSHDSNFYEKFKKKNEPRGQNFRLNFQ